MAENEEKEMMEPEDEEVRLLPDVRSWAFVVFCVLLVGVIAFFGYGIWQGGGSENPVEKADSVATDSLNAVDSLKVDVPQTPQNVLEETEKKTETSTSSSPVHQTTPQRVNEVPSPATQQERPASVAPTVSPTTPAHPATPAPAPSADAAPKASSQPEPVQAPIVEPIE